MANITVYLQGWKKYSAKENHPLPTSVLIRCICWSVFSQLHFHPLLLQYSNISSIVSDLSGVNISNLLCRHGRLLCPSLFKLIHLACIWHMFCSQPTKLSVIKQRTCYNYYTLQSHTAKYFTVIIHKIYSEKSWKILTFLNNMVQVVGIMWIQH